jgi:coenzyme F420-reducing hydrogenase gamma subunit
MNDKIAENLGLRPLAEIREEELEPPLIEDYKLEVDEDTSMVIEHELHIDDENLKDLTKVRENIEGVIALGNEAVREMLEIAKQSESARGFEVVSTLMKTLLDANKDFADVSTKKKFAKEEIMGPRENAQTNVTNNNLIVSTADLLKMLKENENG